MSDKRIMELTTAQSAGATDFVPIDSIAGGTRKIPVTDLPGSGGSSVVPNPQGTPTDTLNTIGISGTIYDIAGSGGGGSSHTIADVLWSGSETPSTTGTDITLSHAISDYDFIVFTVNQNSGYDSLVIITVNELTIGESYIKTGYGGSEMDVFFDYTSDTTIHIKSSASANLTTYTKITGLKFCGTLAPMIYSTEEREVGCWIDNKPLYTKTAHGSGSSDFTIPFDFSNIKVTKIDCIWKDSNGVYRSEPWTTSGTWCKLYAGTIYNGLYVEVNTSVEVWATVYYTKDSDVPGSGSYGSLWVPMVHYDNEERVVGTWTDGRPIYQKTIVADFSTTEVNGGIYSGVLNLTNYLTDITDWENTYINMVSQFSYLTLANGTVRNVLYCDYQNIPNIALCFLYTHRSGVVTLTLQYVKGDDLT